MKNLFKIILITAIAMFIANACGGGSGDEGVKTGKLIIKSVELKDSI